MHRKKLMAFMLIAATAVTAMPVGAFAETVTGDIREITEADLDENNQKDISIPVEYTVGASFTVKLPSAITLSNTDGSWGYSGTVGVKGDIDSGKVVKVTPAESITMYDVTNRPTDDVPAGAEDQAYDHKDAKNATVAQAKKQWAMTELSADTYSDTALTLTAGAMQSGKWKGSLAVNIAYGDEACFTGTHHYTESITREATCTEEGEKTLTCSSCGDTKTETITKLGHVDANDDKVCDVCGSVILTAGETYTLGGYEWVAAEVNDGYVTLQSKGVTGGLWPGYTVAQFGNGSFYESNIDGQDISGYDDKTTALYNSIKSAEYAGASYGTGLYLISKEMAQPSYVGGNYYSALKTAAENHSSFDVDSYGSWLGTIYDSHYPWSVHSNGNVHNKCSQGIPLVLAPAFNLDISKVTLEGYALTVK